MRAPTEKMDSRISQGLRAALVGCFVVAVTAAGLFAYRNLMQPRTLTIAAGAVDSESVRLMTAIAGRLTKSDAGIRLKVVPLGSVLEAAKAFSSGEADLAIVRADLADASKARTVVLINYGVLMIIVPAGSPDTIESLKGKTVGVIGEELNRNLIQALGRDYDFFGSKVRFKDVAIADAPKALRSREVGALLVVTPTSEKYLSLLRSIFAGTSNRRPQLVPIDSAEAIANAAQPYESYELPKGTVRGSPPIPDEDMTTLRVPYYLVAHKDTTENEVAELTKAIMDARRELPNEYPFLTHVTAPSTDKDAYIPVHPGAAAFFEDTQQSFLDRYGNELFLLPMLLGLLASLLTVARKFVGFGPEKIARALDHLHALSVPIRSARSEAELSSIEETMDGIIRAQLLRHSKNKSRAADATVLSLTAQRLERLIQYRRSQLSAADRQARYEPSEEQRAGPWGKP
jgi:TRAP transporter TAXI family solute receptor